MSAILTIARLDVHTAKDLIFAVFLGLGIACVLVTRQWHDGGLS